MTYTRNTWAGKLIFVELSKDEFSSANDFARKTNDYFFNFCRFISIPTVDETRFYFNSPPFKHNNNFSDFYTNFGFMPDEDCYCVVVS